MTTGDAGQDKTIPQRVDPSCRPLPERRELLVLSRPQAQGASGPKERRHIRRCIVRTGCSVALFQYRLATHQVSSGKKAVCSILTLFRARALAFQTRARLWKAAQHLARLALLSSM